MDGQLMGLVAGVVRPAGAGLRLGGDGAVASLVVSVGEAVVNDAHAAGMQDAGVLPGRVVDPRRAGAVGLLLAGLAVEQVVDERGRFNSTTAILPLRG